MNIKRKITAFLGLTLLFVAQNNIAERWSINNKSSQTITAELTSESFPGQSSFRTITLAPNTAQYGNDRILNLTFSPSNNLQAEGIQDYAIAPNDRNLSIILNDEQHSGGRSYN